MKAEIWKSIKGYDGIYMVSNTGKIKSLSRLVNCSNRNNYKIKERLLSPKKHSSGYSVVNLYKNNIGTMFYVHRIVLSSFGSDIINKQCNHKDGNKENNCIDNLEWATPSENMEHATKNNLTRKGSLSKEIINKIRSTYIPRKITLNNLADKYNISFQMVSLIINNKCYKEIN